MHLYFLSKINKNHRNFWTLPHSAHYFWYKSRCDHNNGTQSTQETIPMGVLSPCSPLLPLLSLGLLTLLAPQKAQSVILDRWEFLLGFRLNMYKVVELLAISPRRFGDHQLPLSDNMMPHYNPETRFMRYVPITSRPDGDAPKPRPAKRYRKINNIRCSLS